MKAKTTSINVMNLCVPCENRCRYCLLSYNGTVSGVDYARSEAYAKRFYDWLKANRPDLSFVFGFGYSMEHPNLLSAIDFCKSIGSPTGDFLQFDGMKFRSDSELYDLLCDLKAHGVRLIDLTFYGTEAYHDKFASRGGDYDLMMRTLKQANRTDLDVTVSIPLTHENSYQAEELLSELEKHKTNRISFFVPHSEGRGETLDAIRFTQHDYDCLGNRILSRFNSEKFRSERDWLKSGLTPPNERRMLALTLSKHNIDMFESMSFEDTISYLEELDDSYYNAIPTFDTLCGMYGDIHGDKFYSLRDLFLVYQRRFLKDSELSIYDMNDERQCFSRHF